MMFVCYQRCSTCKRAQAFLDAHGVAYEWRDIKGDHPSEAELRAWQAQSGLPLRRFFNTSGLKYRELGLKDRLGAMGEDEQFALLAGDGLLVKRPVLVDGDQVLVGFNEAAWKEALGL